MTRYLRYAAMLLLTALLTLPACSRQKSSKPASEGNPAPHFILRTLNGEEVRLADLTGQVVLLNFWATWCPPCREEIPSMMRLNTAMAGKPFRMLCVSIDDGGKVAVEEFFRKSGFSLPVLLDSDQQTAKRYGLTGVPETFVIGKDGVILKKVVGAMEWDRPEVVGYLNQAIAK